ncbi:unnamed protein product [Rotaria sordida]|uniref:Exonuclease domain-containing protein n=1 Tax=Rotaria sordida TaxID=392033 RepID=A0A815LNV9_9BILA|nr:unnamed protein product [Rotaria sordida]CAF3637426.1 unnamed protein product [Rotaria sordida]
MASSLPKKNFSSSKDHTDDLEWTKDINTNSFLTEERRLRSSKQCSVKNPTTNQMSQKRLNKFNILVNQMTPEQLDEELKKRQLSTSGEIEIRRFRLKHYYKCELIYGGENPLKMIEQHFEYIAVVDFEATCEEKGDNSYQHEIIEFPIVLINVQQQIIVDKFHSYCRPIIKPILSKFCTELTGIEQHQVDNAPPFVEVLHNVDTWLNERNLLSSLNKRKLAFATDGPWDFAKFLRMQCHLSSIDYPRWAKEWINIRKEFAKFYPVRRCGIEKMLNNLGLSFDGRRHSGIDDAINIARITLELMKDGCVLLFNDDIHASDPKFAALNEKKTEFNKNTDEENDLIVFED